MKFGLLDYKSNLGYYNLGDYVQSIAAKQYLPKVDYLINRENLDKFQEEEVKMIMNGWFMYKVDNWPPSANIDPLFLSFHLNAHSAEKLLAIPGNISYFKKFAPIGCRDMYTVGILKKHNIDAYYSSCLTTTIQREVPTRRTNKILFVDVLFNLDKKSYYERVRKHFWRDKLLGRLPELQSHTKTLKEYFPKEVIDQAVFETHFIKADKTNVAQRFAEAERLLDSYAGAKLVVTSRIHCALPCLALGTPVIFVLGGGLNNASDLSRLDGIIQHFNIVNLNSSIGNKYLDGLNIMDLKDINWDEPVKNPDNFKKYTPHLKETCQSFIKGLSGVTL